jgi:hypothetical protein
MIDKSPPSMSITRKGPPQPTPNPKSQRQKTPSGTPTRPNLVQAPKKVAPKQQVSIKTAPKESTPPMDVQLARQQQTEVLLRRQARETRGRIGGAPRDVDAGAGLGTVRPIL